MIKIGIDLGVRGSKASSGSESSSTDHCDPPKWLPDDQKIEDLFALLSGYGYRVMASDTLQHNTADFGDYLFFAE
jgi:hypothetical protein